MSSFLLISDDEEILYSLKVFLNELNNSSFVIDAKKYKKKEEVLIQIKNLKVNSVIIDYNLLINKPDMFGLTDVLNCKKILLCRNKNISNVLKSKFDFIILRDEEIKGELRKIVNQINEENKKYLDYVLLEKKKKSYKGFLFLLAEKYNINISDLERIGDFDRLKDFCVNLGLREEDLYKESASYLGYDYVSYISVEDLILDKIPLKFMESHKVVLISKGEEKFMVLSNPFDYETLNLISNLGLESNSIRISSADNILKVLHLVKKPQEDLLKVENGDESININKDDVKKIDSSPIIYITNKIIESSIKMRASDIHIEPKEKYYVIRFRIDGDLVEYTKIRLESGVMVIARLKALAKMDITEKRRPQDGSVAIKIGDKKYILRISTTSTNYGEELVSRIIDMTSRVQTLRDLGMYPEQEEVLKNASKSSQGIVIIAAPTGSGKTTTIYSFISMLDLTKKKLMSVEDPVEFRIPNAVQQEVNDKAGVTFSSLLKASVRQDPDILFLGEIRDEESAKIAFDFSSTGHFTITTIHTANATSAINRLERLGITRQQIAETVLALISQRLLKKLCPHCKTKSELSKEEIEVFKKFKVPFPSLVYKPVGCSKCFNTGYYSRIAIYEIIKFTPDIYDMIVSFKSIKEIRKYMFNNSQLLMPIAALKRVADGVVDFKMAWEKIIAEEINEMENEQTKNEIYDNKKLYEDKIAQMKESQDDDNLQKKILVVDDDKDLLDLITKILISANYNVETSEDGLDALIKIAKNNYDLVISDYNMPNLDGLKLIKTINKKGLNTKIIMLTASDKEDTEENALLYGAVDFIKKPFKKDVLLLRISKALGVKK